MSPKTHMLKAWNPVLQYSVYVCLGLFGDDCIMRALISPTCLPIDGFIA
jgi:hypothetical protein